VNRPTRATADGRVYLDLQNLARRQGRPTGELHQLYALEGFLARLARSRFLDHLILKGGALLAAYEIRRPTRDIDLEGRHLSGDAAHLVEVVREIANIPLDDGLLMNPGTVRAQVIRDGPDDPYSGVRIHVQATLAGARMPFHVDVSVGDPIIPEPGLLDIPRLLPGEPISVIGYPIPMVHAEKIVTVVQRGVTNTRWRDFADVFALTGLHDVDGTVLTLAVHRVAEFRQTPISPLRELLADYASFAQPRWSSWRRKQQLDVPVQFATVVDQVIKFADPALSRTVAGKRWQAGPRAWS
jgi:hypothetical protein